MNMNLSKRLHKVVRYFQQPEKTAKLAKERLQIIIAHERVTQDNPDYLASLQKDLLDVIAKYVEIDRKDVKFDVANKDGFSILELNVTLPK